jgi:hypothetical protein
MVHPEMPYLNPSPQVNALIVQLSGLATSHAECQTLSVTSRA